VAVRRRDEDPAGRQRHPVPRSARRERPRPADDVREARQVDAARRADIVRQAIDALEDSVNATTEEALAATASG
jgi:hypothetical protein